MVITFKITFVSHLVMVVKQLKKLTDLWSFLHWSVINGHRAVIIFHKYFEQLQLGLVRAIILLNNSMVKWLVMVKYIIVIKGVTSSIFPSSTLFKSVWFFVLFAMSLMTLWSSSQLQSSPNLLNWTWNHFRWYQSFCPRYPDVAFWLKSCITLGFFCSIRTVTSALSPTSLTAAATKT